MAYNNNNHISLQKPFTSHINVHMYVHMYVPLRTNIIMSRKAPFHSFLLPRSYFSTKSHTTHTTHSYLILTHKHTFISLVLVVVIVHSPHRIHVRLFPIALNRLPMSTTHKEQRKKKKSNNKK